MRYDVIVVGARCAGSPLAMLLARKGYRTLLVDKAHFPSDTLSTHFIHQAGAARLERWRLLERVQATGCPGIPGGQFDFGFFSLAGRPPPAGDITEAIAPRRVVLDQILLEAALASGVEWRESFAVEDLVRDGERVIGIRGRHRRGATTSAQARIVVGADGWRSTVARLAGATAYEERPSLTCLYYSYWSDVSLSRFEVYVRPRRLLIAFPTHEGLTTVLTIWPHEEFETIKRDVEGNFMATVDLAPSLAERLRDGRRQDRFFGTGDLPNFFRTPCGPGWALVGDAGYHKDPLTAQGISDAFRDVDLLADAIDDGLSERVPLSDALARYERSRNEAAMPMYGLTCDRALLAPPPAPLLELLLALRGNQADTDRFFGIDAGTVAVADFFSPENVQRLLNQAGSSRIESSGNR